MDEQRERRSRPPLSRGRRSLGRLARIGGALLPRTNRSSPDSRCPDAWNSIAQVALLPFRRSRSVVGTQSRSGGRLVLVRSRRDRRARGDARLFKEAVVAPRAWRVGLYSDQSDGAVSDGSSRLPGLPV
jgi:hypothetical protein